MSTNTLRSRSPIRLTMPAGLLDLREQVLARSTKRMPKWKFRLASDAVMMLQPKVGKHGRVATRNGDAWEWIDFPRHFEGRLLICEGASADKLLKHPVGMLYCQQQFAISTGDAGGHRIVGTGFSANTGLKDQTEREARWNELDRQSTDTLLTALADGRFDTVKPAMMLTPNCWICGKALTDPVSMARGIGPECAGTGSVHVPRMQNLVGGADEAAPVPRRPIKPPVLLKEAPEPDGGSEPPTIIRSLDDVTIVPTPVRMSCNGKEWVEEKPRALLFNGREPATMILSNIYGRPFVTVGKLTLIDIHERGAGGRSPWGMTLHIVPHGKRATSNFVNREFPTSEVLIAWGYYDIDLTDLPPLASARWAEVSRRFHAVAKHTVWLDTTKAACAGPARRDRGGEEEARPA